MKIGQDEYEVEVEVSRTRHDKWFIEFQQPNEYRWVLYTTDEVLVELIETLQSERERLLCM